MIRRRDLFACASVCAVSAAWSFLVVVYCIGTARRQSVDRKALRDLSGRVDAISEASERVASAISALRSTVDEQRTHARQIQDASNILGGSEPKQEPRLLGRGRTRSPRFVWLYEDWQMPDGSTQRRYILRLPLDGPASGGLGGNNPPAKAVNPLG